MKNIFLLFATILLSINSYAQEPTYEWVKSISGDYGYNIVVDGGGNAYITGWFSGTRDFDPSVGTANLSAVGGADIFFAKYDTDGNYLWAKSMGGVDNDHGFCTSVDGNGNVYITGWFRETADFDPGIGTANLSSAGFNDIFLAKYDANGNYLWAHSFGDVDTDIGSTISVDGSGNVYITGWFSGTVDFDPGVGTAELGSGGGQNIFFAKYDSNGNYLWAKSLGSAGYGYGIAVDGSGNAYVTGYFGGTGDFDPGVGTANLSAVGDYDIFFAKYDSNGNYLWAKSIGGTDYDQSRSIAIDGSGNVYITGSFQGTADFDPGVGMAGLTSIGDYDIFFAKYDSNGNYLWAKSIGSTGISYERGYSIAVDGSSSVYITGYFNGTADFNPGAGTANLSPVGDYDIFFAKYDANGNYLWAKSFGNADTDIGYSIAVDGSSNTYITGVFRGTVDFDPGVGTAELNGLGGDIFFAKYSQNGGTGPVIGLSGNLAFGDIITNQTAQLAYTINNTGTTDLTVSSISYPAGFTGDWSGGVIAAAGSQTVTVTFAPTLVQTYSGVVTVNSDATSGANTLAISGNGVTNQITGLTVSGNLDFGTVVQGSSDDMPVLLHNNTSSVITITNISPSPIGVFNALMQNGGTILPNQTLPVSIFFFPPGLATYNATFTITSDAPNGDVTFTTTGTGGNNPVSWIGIYNKPENNPEITQLLPLDEHYVTVGQVSPTKICADGSEATVLKFTNNDVSVTTSNILLRMQSDPNGSNTDYSGSFISPYTYSGSTITASFSHPLYLDVAGLYRRDTIEVVNTSNGTVLYKQPVQIYRAPVVLVHGLWGGMTSMLTVFSELLSSGKYNASLLRVTDYSNTNSSSFVANSNVIKNNINTTLMGLRFLNYSAGKVDIVAHSMGGVLSRIYLQNNDCGGGLQTNCYRGDIRKLITLNTPHSGTQVANFIFSNAFGSGLARTILNYNGMPWDNGAVYDLQCNSPAITSLNGSSLNNHIVPCHAIQTDRIPSNNYLSFDEEALVNIIANARLQSVGNFVNEVFDYTPTDLIVPTNSQKGGLNDFTYVQNVKHTASPHNSSVINSVKTLLEENPVTSVYFDQNGSGFNPPVIVSTFKTDETDVNPNVQAAAGDVTITNPTFGFTTSEGDVVQIDVAATGNIDHLIITAGNVNTGVTSFDTLANSATVYFTVPTNITGPVKIMAIGFDNNGFVDLDTLEIIANTTATLDSLAFVNDYINIPLGQSLPFTLYGYFSDSTVRNLNVISNIPYNTNDISIASVGSHLLNGLTVGTTYLHAAYQGKNAYVTVNVYAGDDWIINSIEDEHTNDPTKYGQFTVYPNPATQTLSFINGFKGSTDYELHGILGNLLLSGAATPGLNEISVDGLAKGIYLLQLSDGNKVYSAKFVKQ